MIANKAMKRQPRTKVTFLLKQALFTYTKSVPTNMKKTEGTNLVIEVNTYKNILDSSIEWWYAEKTASHPYVTTASTSNTKTIFLFLFVCKKENKNTKTTSEKNKSHKNHKGAIPLPVTTAHNRSLTFKLYSGSIKSKAI